MISVAHAAPRSMVSPDSFRDLMVHRVALFLISSPLTTKPPPNSSEYCAKSIWLPFLTKTLPHWSALVDHAPDKSKACTSEDSKNPLQTSKTHNPVDRLKLNIDLAPSMELNSAASFS